MKTVLYLMLMLLSLEPALSQTSFNNMMKSALHMHDTSKTWHGEQKVAKYYEQIINEYPKEWLSAYWASYIYTQLANGIGRVEDSPKDAKKTDFLDHAQRTLNIAKKRYAGDSTEFKSDLHAMQSFIYYFYGRYGSEDQKEPNSRKADEEMKKALQYNSANPLVYVLIGTSLVRSEDFKEVVAGRLLLYEAKKLFREVDEHRALTTQWNEEWLRFFWLKHADQQVAKVMSK